MGVPKFFRWISERYPKINQRYGAMPKTETCQRYFDKDPPAPLEAPDPLSTCGLPPEIDRLYIDMNGIIHGCSHNNDDDLQQESDEKTTKKKKRKKSKRIPNEEIFRNVCYYLDRIIGDMVQPNQLVYMAIDGVAPRAKLNQQRSRRFQSGKEGAIGTNIYDAHAKALQEQQEAMEQQEEDDDREQRKQSWNAMDDAYDFVWQNEQSFGSANSNNTEEPKAAVTNKKSIESKGKENSSKETNSLVEVSPGRFKGKFKTEDVDEDDGDTFHSNVITPGTPFFSEFTQHLEHFIKYKLSTDPKWKDLTIIFSGPNVPGEGEHKIMQFIREQKSRDDYNPNLRHCIMGQDGDLLMLGLATHEPNLVLLRERVTFNMSKKRIAAAAYSNSLDAYIHNPFFEFLHMGVLRDYLAYEFETSNVIQSSPWNIEHTIDDFNFMTFFIGNDFLPHLPALDIGDHAFDLLFWTYKNSRKKWYHRDKSLPYLTNAGNIVSGSRLESFLSAVGAHEVSYYDKKKGEETQENIRMQSEYKKLGIGITIPDEQLKESKERSDREAFRQMLKAQTQPENTLKESFAPVVTGDVGFQPVQEEIEEGILTRMGSLLQNSLSKDSETSSGHATVDDQDLKARYYYDKFEITPFDADSHLALRKSYLEGLVWNLKYYYEGCVSWEWFYPYHYGPMLSDLVGLDQLLREVSFEGKMGEPLKPFEQLMGCMPPSHAHHLPEPYRWLMVNPTSPIVDFYPREFVIDMNGKRWPWEAVVLLPFIDSKRLKSAASSVDESLLTDFERSRNATGNCVVVMHDPHFSEFTPAVGTSEGFQEIQKNKAVSVPFEVSEWHTDVKAGTVLKPELTPGVDFPLAGFGSLRSAPVKTLFRRRMGINVFGTKSRYRTAYLEMSSFVPPLPPLEYLGPKLIGTSVFVNYPYFLEGLVTAVSDGSSSVRGKLNPRNLSEEDAKKWHVLRDWITKQMEAGEGHTGTGGLIIPGEQDVTLSVRPLQGTSEAEDGQILKQFAKFEIEVPLIATFWNPSQVDPRLVDLPSKLEKNAYTVAKPLHQVNATQMAPLYGQSKHKNRKGGRGPPPKKKSSGSYRRTAIANYSTVTHASCCYNMSSFGNPVTSHPDDITSLSSRTGYPSALHSRQVQCRKFEPKVVTPSIRKVTAKPIGLRGRIFAVGVAAVTLLSYKVHGVTWPALFHRASNRHSRHSVLDSTLHFRKTPDTLSFTLPSIRGGDFVEKMETRLPIPPVQFAHGTTTMSFVFDGGIVVAVDSRATMGSFVGSKTVEKVLPINSHILGTMAGGAADCKYWIGKIQREANLHKLKEGGRISVARASRLLSDVLYEYRDTLDLSVGTMIMGFDESGSPSIYYVDNRGTRIQGDMFAVGSGSTFALGILDVEHRSDLSSEQAVALGVKAIRHATFRDAFSGGFINVFLITKDGWKKVFTEDIARLPAVFNKDDEYRNGIQ